MKRIASCVFLSVWLLQVSPGEGVDNPLVLAVWPGKVPGDYGTIGAERVRAPSEAPTKDAKWITNVTKPTITVFRPPKGKNTGAAMVICPGGGYWNRVVTEERGDPGNTPSYFRTGVLRRRLALLEDTLSPSVTQS